MAPPGTKIGNKKLTIEFLPFEGGPTLTSYVHVVPGASAPQTLHDNDIGHSGWPANRNQKSPARIPGKSKRLILNGRART